MNKKVLDILELCGYYLICFGLGFLPYPFLRNAGVPYLLDLLICDSITTVLIFAVGCLKRTSSVYDPYWSVQTFLACFIVAICDGVFHPVQILVWIPLVLYSLRLTWHFGKTFSGYDYVDWRYRHFKKISGKAFPLVNFFGIHFFPTLIVFAASVPIFLFIRYGGSYFDANPTLTAIMASLFFVFSIGAVGLSHIADRQMDRFKENRGDASEVCQKGLWSISRHPNYLGEISFWYCGIFLLVLDPNPLSLVFIAAPVAITLMFLLYSIPAIEKRMMSRKPLFEEYVAEVHTLLLLPRKKRKRKPTDYDSQEN